MRRRLERDRKRVHAYHDDLRSAAVKRLATPARAGGDRADAERRRDTLRVEAIEREYRAKLDDLRHNYALRVTVEWVQALELYVPVQRLDVLIRRRKGERVVQLDWHPLVKAAEPPLCEAGLAAIVSVWSATKNCISLTSGAKMPAFLVVSHFAALAIRQSARIVGERSKPDTSTLNILRAKRGTRMRPPDPDWQLRTQESV